VLRVSVNQLYFFIQEAFDKEQLNIHLLNQVKQVKIMNPYDFYLNFPADDRPFPFFIVILAIAHVICYLFLL